MRAPQCWHSDSRASANAYAVSQKHVFVFFFFFLFFKQKCLKFKVRGILRFYFNVSRIFECYLNVTRNTRRLIYYLILRNILFILLEIYDTFHAISTKIPRRKTERIPKSFSHRSFKQNYFRNYRHLKLSHGQQNENCKSFT